MVRHARSGVPAVGADALFIISCAVRPSVHRVVVLVAELMFSGAVMMHEGRHFHHVRLGEVPRVLYRLIRMPKVLVVVMMFMWSTPTGRTPIVVLVIAVVAMDRSALNVLHFIQYLIEVHDRKLTTRSAAGVVNCISHEAQ